MLYKKDTVPPFPHAWNKITVPGRSTEFSRKLPISHTQTACPVSQCMTPTMKWNVNSQWPTVKEPRQMAGTAVGAEITAGKWGGTPAAEGAYDGHTRDGEVTKRRRPPGKPDTVPGIAEATEIWVPLLLPSLSSAFMESQVLGVSNETAPLLLTWGQPSAFKRHKQRWKDYQESGPQTLDCITKRWRAA